MKKTNKTQKVQPAHQLRSRSVKCALWRNETDKGVFHNITLERIYKDGEVWKSSSSFGISDTGDLETVIKQAREWVANQPKETAPAAA
jgi:hypothetical protein